MARGIKWTLNTERWRRAEQAAAALDAPALWRQRLCQQLRVAADARFVSVVQCRDGDWTAVRGAAATPAEFSAFNEEMLRLLPRVSRSGDDWRHSQRLHAGARVLAPLDGARDASLASYVSHTWLYSRGVIGLVAALLLDVHGELLGLIFVGSARDKSAVLLRRVRAPLGKVAAAAERTLQQCIAMAAEHGARPLPKQRAKLTSRQAGVLREVLTGASDREVAQRLGISEDTVGVHLRAIYRRLGVRKRSLLAARVEELGAG